MCEDHDRCRFVETGDVFLQPRELLCTDFRFGPRYIVQSDEMNGAVIEGVIGLAENVTVETASIQPGVVLSWNILNGWDVHALGDFHELLHALSMDVFVLAVMGQIASEQNKIGTLRHLIDYFHSSFKSFGA